MARQHPRLDAPTSNPNSAEHRRQLATRANAGLSKDGGNKMNVPLTLHSVKLAQVSGVIQPNSPYYPAKWEGGAVYVEDIDRIAYSTGGLWVLIPGPGDYVPQSMAFILVPKTASPPQSTTTLAPDAELIFPVAASKTYTWRGTIFIEAPFAQDFQFSFTGPTFAGPPVAGSVRYSYAANGAPAGSNPYVGMATAFATAFQLLSGTANSYVLNVGGILVNGVTAGTVAFNWAPVTAGAVAVMAGSYLEYRQW